jgi:pseudouridine synthase
MAEKHVAKTVEPLIRLNRFLAMSGVCSRREADRLIEQGEVKVNGKTVRTLGVQVDPEHDEVRVRGNVTRAVQARAYVMLNKPAGFVTTVKDEQGRPTAVSLVRAPYRLFPVGRLDFDSEGLLLLTNDGELSHRLMHPRFKIPKVYRVLLNEPAAAETARAFERGVKIEAEGKPVRGELRFSHPRDHRLCEVTIWEGRNRQVRRMFAKTGLRVKGLQRIQVGPLRLGKLQLGAWRHLADDEIERLFDAVNLERTAK